MRKFSIKDWAVDDQPRKKLMQRGSAALSNAELLTILINNGNAFLSANDIAKHLLMASENNLQKLASMSVKDMVNLKIKGLGEAKAIAIAASLELGIRRQSDPIQQKQVSSSKDVAGYLQNTLQFL